MSILSANKLTKFFGPDEIFSDITVDVPPGARVALVGPNGAGKTTTISMWTGLYPPTAGHCTICGHDLLTEMSTINQLMGVCPQFDILWPSLTVTETISLYCSIKGIKSRSVATKIVDSVNLSHVAHRFVGRLSGGMKRRVSLAIARTAQPHIPSPR